MRRIIPALVLSIAAAPPGPAAAQAPPVPAVNLEYEEETLPNGLRVIYHVDRSAPVAATVLWYDVASKHEQTGKTGFAHLFEHLMLFTGSRNAPEGRHFALLEAVGSRTGTDINGTTSWDRTNFFQQVPSHALELALWLEADRMATLDEALNETKLVNQREVVKNERRQSNDNQPYGMWVERMLAQPVSRRASLPPPGDRLHAGPGERVAGGRARLLPHVLRSQQRRAGHRGRHRHPADAADGAPLLRRHRARAGAAAGAQRAPAAAAGRVEARGDPGPQRARAGRLRGLPRPRRGATRGRRRCRCWPDVLATGRSSPLYQSLVRDRQAATSVFSFNFGLVEGADMLVVGAVGKPGASADSLEAALLAELDGIAARIDAEGLQRAQAAEGFYAGEPAADHGRLRRARRRAGGGRRPARRRGVDQRLAPRAQRRDGGGRCRRWCASG